MKLNLSIDEINLIKYAILALPPGKSTTYIYTNFETRSGPSLLPRTNDDSEAYIREINNVVARNIRKSLQSYQRHSFSKSKYTPLPRDYSPYDYIRPKFGSEHYLLPPFTFDIWISQFPPRTTEMGRYTKKKKTTTTPQRESSFATKDTKDVANEIVVSPRIPDFFRPKIISTNTPVLKEPCDIHIHMTFDKNGMSAAGDLFGLYAMMVNNGAEKDGIKVDVMVLCHVRPTPLDSALPFGHVPYVGSDKKTIFMRMASGIDPKFIGEMKAKTVACMQKALGTDSPQVETYFDAMETKIAECPVSHSIVAVTFNGCPPFVSNKEALIQFQSDDAIASHENGLSAIFTSMGYKFKEEVYKLQTTYNLIGYTYILLLDTDPLKVKEHKKKSSKSHFSSMVENARKSQMEYGSDDDTMGGLNGRFDDLSVGESTESEGSSNTFTSDHDRRHSSTKSKSRGRRSTSYSGNHHRHHHSASKSDTHHRSASKSGDRHRSASKSGGHRPKSASKSHGHRRRSTSKSGYHHRSSSTSDNRHRKSASASKSDDRHCRSSSKRGDRRDYFESDEEVLSSSYEKYHGGSGSHRTSKSDNHGRRGTSHGRRSKSKSGNHRHHAASSGRRDDLHSETGSDQRRNKSRRNKSRRRQSAHDPDGSKSIGGRHHGSTRSDKRRRSTDPDGSKSIGSSQHGSVKSDQRRHSASNKSDPDGSKSSSISQYTMNDQLRRSVSKDGTYSVGSSHGSNSTEAGASTSRRDLRESGASTSSPDYIDDRKFDIPRNIDVDDLYVGDSSNNQPSTPGTKGSLIEQIGRRSSQFFAQVLGTPDVREHGGSPSEHSRATERTKSKSESEPNHTSSNSYGLRSKTNKSKVN